MDLAFGKCLIALFAVYAHASYGQPADDIPGKTTRPPAIERLHVSAKGGDATAQYELGRRYDSGQGVDVDKDLALKLYEASAAQGFARAQYELARSYRGLSGDRVDLQQALFYTRKAAEQGYSPAQADLGFIYYNGNGRTPRDLVAAFGWFEKAAVGGAVAAQCMLGDFYKNGLGRTERNYAEAFKWYRLTATTQNNCAPKSQFELYIAYESGNGVKKDLQAAVTWLTSAAKAGNPQAQFTLARLYQIGYGVDQDDVLSRTWLKKSREGVSYHEDHDHELPSFAGPTMTRLLSVFRQ